MTVFYYFYEMIDIYPFDDTSLRMLYNIFMNLVSVKDIYYSYDNTRNAIDGISFEIKKGSYTCIIGHNGSGKSTVAKLISGLLELKQGEILIDGMTLNYDNLYKIREKMGIVFQNPDNQFIGSTVRDDIAFGLENHCVPHEKMDELIDEYAKQVGIYDYLDKEPGNLSGGQKQRVAIAGVMAMCPKLLIFDEATSMLDPRGKKDIKGLMQQLNQDDEYTIISITHDIEEVLYCDDVLVLNQGKVFMHDTPENVFERIEELRKINLDIPFDLKVKEAFRKKGIRLKNKDLKGMAEELWQLSSKH